MGGSCREGRQHFSGFEHTLFWAAQGGPGGRCRPEGGKDIFQPFSHDSSLLSPTTNDTGQISFDIPVSGLLPMPFMLYSKVEASLCYMSPASKGKHHFPGQNLNHCVVLARIWWHMGNACWVQLADHRESPVLIISSFKTFPINHINGTFNQSPWTSKGQFLSVSNLVSKSLICFFPPFRFFIFISAHFFLGTAWRRYIQLIYHYIHPFRRKLCRF